MNYIGLDWGQRKIGTAFGDSETRMAFGGGLFENDGMIFDQLASLAQQHDGCTFVLGITSHDDQHDNQEAIKTFAKKLKDLTPCKVEFANEMFTTKQAHENLKAAGKKDIASLDDIEAARILLQDFLDNLPKNSQKSKVESLLG